MPTPVPSPLAASPVHRLEWVGVLLGIAFLILVVHGHVVQSNWCCDDPQILKHALRFSPHEYFAIPEAWRALIPFSLTPWLTLAYDLDLFLFGLNPAGAYLHQLAAIAGCSLLVYANIRRWTSPGLAAAGTAMFVCGAPLVIAAEQLMVRHYVEGLLLFLVSLRLHVAALDRRNFWFAMAAGLAFAASVTAKEVFLPLGLVMAALPIADLRGRARMAAPLLTVVALYIPWRHHMLGDMVGGYGQSLSTMPTTFGLAVQQFLGFPGMLWSHPAVASVAMGLLLLGAIVLSRDRLAWLMWLGLVTAALLLPLVPLAVYPGLGAGSERYLIVPWAIVSLLVPVAARRWQMVGSGWMMPLAAWTGIALLLAMSVPTATAARVRLTAEKQVYRAIGEALLSRDAPTVILTHPGIPTWFTQGMIDLRPQAGRSTPAPIVMADESEFAEQLSLRSPILQFDDQSRGLREVGNELIPRIAPWKAGLTTRPLDIEMTYVPGERLLSWALAPHTNGQYLYLHPGGATPVPARGSIRMDAPPEGCFRFRFNASEGWIAYTPWLQLNALPDGRRHVHWRGASVMPTSAPTPSCQGMRPEAAGGSGR
jgi:hypothetical protein